MKPGVLIWGCRNCEDKTGWWSSNGSSGGVECIVKAEQTGFIEELIVGGVRKRDGKDDSKIKM